MSYEQIIKGIIILIGVIFFFLNSRRMYLSNENGIDKKDYSGGLLFIIIFYILFSSNNFEHLYINNIQEDLKRNNLPIIDSKMSLYSINNNEFRFISNSIDSIRHTEKVINYDLGNIDKTYDHFYNKIEKLGLEYIYERQNIFRNESRIIILRGDKGLDTISLKQTDSIFEKWNIPNVKYQ